jgi:uncharacterized protein GlcG (DUF336 family)
MNYPSDIKVIWFFLSRKNFLAFFLPFALAHSPAASALPTKQVLPSALAVRIAESAISACAAKGQQIAVAIVDPAGGLRVLIAADGVKAIDIDSARRKARTASALATSTLEIASKVAASPDFGKLLLTLDPQLLLLGGGRPIKAGADLVGAIGVGGAPGPEGDDSCAGAALAAAGALLR